ncbi:chromate efflux transporter [Shewanella sp. UCD-KL12]|uniref:chromate efflux transporter n=1 Tax=Shewanella sp. UCD-KL12 TaxID=1917163 RepID=UPI000970D34C|nr:chromate efflux transporter [Shewanella sp. UCD-KL12]
MWQIFFRFLTLGLVSFGGPAAHIGYFRQTFVNDLNWLDDKHYGSLVALSQVMPGPGSSQVGFGIGYHRGGLLGGLAAFIGFTLPSFLLLFVLAISSAQWLDSDLFQGVIHGLKLLAVVVVADAIWIMFNQFCEDHLAKVLMVVSAILLLLSPTLVMQTSLLVLAAIVGAMCLSLDNKRPISPNQTGKPLAYGWLISFAVLFIIALVAMQTDTKLAVLFGQFYQAGSLVFGGGHVVLPLLESAVGGAVGSDRFLTGYALAQAVPGPMFSLAAFLGAELLQESPLIGAIVATLAIFLPGFLLMLTALRSWDTLNSKPKIIGALAGINACVVGFLIAAFYNPVFSSAVSSLQDLIIVVLGFTCLKLLKPNILLLLIGFITAGVLPLVVRY